MLINQNARNGVTHIDWADITDIKTSDYHEKLLIFIPTDYDVKYFTDIHSNRKFRRLEKYSTRYHTPYVIELDRFVADNYDIFSSIKNFYRKYQTN